MAKVELVYVAKDKTTFHAVVDCTSGTTVADVIHQSGLMQAHPETLDMPVGIFAKAVALDTLVKDGDRVEVYRSLVQDPKEKRRAQARTRARSRE